MTTRESLRIGFLLNRHGSLEAAGVVRGDIAEGARFLEALKIRSTGSWRRRDARRLGSGSSRRRSNPRARSIRSTETTPQPSEVSEDARPGSGPAR
jgi:hypothetical protein